MKLLFLSCAIGMLICSGCGTGIQNADTAGMAALESEAKTSWQNIAVEQISLPDSTPGAQNERGVLTVPVKRSNPAGQAVGIEFYRFKRLPDANPDTPPIFLLRGGPGYPGLGDSIHDDTFYRRAVYPYTKSSDLIIVGQRGFGTSGDLSCDRAPPSSLEEVSSSLESRARYRRTAEQCRDKYLTAGIDLSGYNIKEMADDVASIASELGYKKIQIKGTSFGSFWGMAVIRQHPTLVARAVFSALEGPDHTFDRPSAVKNTFSKMAAAAATSERYKDRIPEEGLIAAYQSVIDRAEESPIQTSFVHDESGETIDMVIDADALRRFVYGVSRKPVFRYTMHDWPDDLLNIIEGDFSELAYRVYRHMTRTDADNAAEEIIECSSGISAQRRDRIENDPAKSLINPPVLFDLSDCAVWENAIADMDRSHFETDIPTVLIHGTWDISTPYEDAKTVRKMFSNHRFVTVEGGSHGAMFEAQEHFPDFIDALDQWYATGDPSAVPETISLPPLSWAGDE